MGGSFAELGEVELGFRLWLERACFDLYQVDGLGHSFLIHVGSENVIAEEVIDGGCKLLCMHAMCRNPTVLGRKKVWP